ncbi:MAG: 2-phospho-L-lactate guanylyltransferase [Rhizorhabdus sp.]|nr:2-phospho-L-lactate guanylyltransferase [Rhizorhabdus sp.]
MSWTAVVPIKQGTARKSRLSAELSPEERERLSDQLVTRVLDALAAAPSVSRIVALSNAPLPSSSFQRELESPFSYGDTMRKGDPSFRWDDERDVNWHLDEGRGLNPELTAFRSALPAGRLLVIHGDLPLVTPDDIEAMLAAAEQAGIAIAPDRHGSGTNALALRDPAPFTFAFGEGSCAAHHAAAGEGAMTVNRPGLSHDIDTPDDLAAARTAGFVWPR